MCKIQFWVIVLALLYDNGRIDFDVRRDLYEPFQQTQRSMMADLKRAVGIDRLERALDRRL